MHAVDPGLESGGIGNDTIFVNRLIVDLPAVADRRKIWRCGFKTRIHCLESRGQLVRNDDVIHGMIGIPARWRLDHNFYSLPFELWLKDMANRLPHAPKAKVDAHQLEAEAVSC